MQEAKLKREDWPLVATILYITLLTIWSPTAVTAALPQIQAHFADTPNAGLLARLVLTLPPLFVALSAPIAGWAIDRYGRKPVLLISISLYALVGPAGLYLESLSHLLCARALLGLAIGGTMTTAITLIGDHFDGPRRARVMGFQSAALEFGAVVFTLAGGVLAGLSWRSPFAIYFLAIPLIPLTLMVIRGERHGGTMTGRDATANQEAAAAGIPPIAWAGYALGIVTMVGIFLIPVHLPFFMAQDLGLSNPVDISIVIGTSTLFAGLAATFYQRIRSRYSTLAMFIPCYLFMSLGYLVLSMSQHYYLLIAGAALAGSGIGLFLPNINLWVVGIAPPQQRGRIVSGLMSGIFVGQFASPLLSTPLANRLGIDQLFAITSLMLFLTACVFLLLVVLLPKLRTTDQQHHSEQKE